MFLDEQTFKTVLDSTPLISLDLIIINDRSEVLLGRRNNRPAQGFWFVPGGRIQKNETIAGAFDRLTNEELGFKVEINKSVLLGIYDHIYDDSVFGANVTTHYVAAGHVIRINEQLRELPLDIQHSEYQWISISDIEKHALIHNNTKAYFKHNFFNEVA